MENRRSFVKSNFLCYNCLLAGHRVSNCCLRITCRKCSQKHNTLLHPEFESDSHETGVSGSRPAGSNDREDSIHLLSIHLLRFYSFLFIY